MENLFGRKVYLIFLSEMIKTFWKKIMTPGITERKKTFETIIFREGKIRTE